MNPSWEAVLVGAVLFATMAAYALFAGADFGAGIWDLLAGSTARGERPRAAIDDSVTPVWEGNQTWIVLGIVWVWSAFPTAFAAIMTALFVPLSLSLLGILLRGIGFAFRHEAERLRTRQLSGALFAASSFIAPFFLGVAIGAVASGHVHRVVHGNVASAWLNPTALLTGALFVASCAYISAVYLVQDSRRRDQPDMVRYFSRRAVAAGVVTGVLAAITMWLLRGSDRYLFDRLLGPALPLVAVSVAAGLAALLLIVTGRPRGLRIAAALAVAAVVAAWGVAQYPWLLPRTLSLGAGAAPTSSLTAELVVAALALLFVAPAFGYLYWLQQHGRLQVTEGDLLVRSRPDEPEPAARERRGVPVVSAAVLGAAAWRSLRSGRSGRPARRGGSGPSR